MFWDVYNFFHQFWGAGGVLHILNCDRTFFSLKIAWNVPTIFLNLTNFFFNITNKKHSFITFFFVLKCSETYANIFYHFWGGGGRDLHIPNCYVIGYFWGERGVCRSCAEATCISTRTTTPRRLHNHTGELLDLLIEFNLPWHPYLTPRLVSRSISGFGLWPRIKNSLTHESASNVRRCLPGI